MARQEPNLSCNAYYRKKTRPVFKQISPSHSARASLSAGTEATSMLLTDSIPFWLFPRADPQNNSSESNKTESDITHRIT
ncbi:hypothetical protein NPIL_132551 [Nephila pilipes]|uniref:Uncharacterized protein n=1 Tax=Nephila pilipes TaxID=299642 RepID=A0A8X6PZR4_NEPPI|nr:hypothetical protein NPIL_634811 [Nephila pilipes]GFT74234.1 hypothetical protein NPIL_529421 [Nephila pilipes]GFT98273.1 hypothetical protein NPIL_94841 [Nephila pilipes]GFU32319.1 hypothetical protein NPIL_132551 [Nephila pilipes]